MQGRREGADEQQAGEGGRQRDVRPDRVLAGCVAHLRASQPLRRAAVSDLDAVLTPAPGILTPC
jgi:hypothetical protein